MQSQHYGGQQAGIMAYTHQESRRQLSRIGNFDPEELTRRLEAHLAEQRAMRECRRRRLIEKDFAAHRISLIQDPNAIVDARILTQAQAAAQALAAVQAKAEVQVPANIQPEAKSHAQAQVTAQDRAQVRARAKAHVQSLAQGPTPYHHVPKVAAVDFIKSATQDSMPFGSSKSQQSDNKGQHALARAALRKYNEPVKVDPRDVLKSGLARTKSEDKARRQKQTIAERNQFQRDQLLEEAAQYDRERDIYAPIRRSFGTDPLSVIVNGSMARPTYEVDLNDEDGGQRRGSDAFPRPKRIIPNVNDHLDWAQRDDTPVEHSSMRDRLSPLLKRPESKWTLRKKDSKHDSGFDDALASPTETKFVKPRKSTFLGRFRREGKEAES